MAPKVSDHHALPDSILNAYLYPLGAWGIALAMLFLYDRPALSIPLCYPLALWQIGLTLKWGRDVKKRYDADELNKDEVEAGVLSVGHTVAASALLPGIVFVANDPLASTSYATFMGVVLVTVIAWFAVSVLVRPRNRWTHALALGVALLALPINATGGITVAFTNGLFDRFLLSEDQLEVGAEPDQEQTEDKADK